MPQRKPLKLPPISQFSIACYAGFIALAALYVAHTSANTSADAAILANKIGTARLYQAQACYAVQVLVGAGRPHLPTSVKGVWGPAASRVPEIVALTNFQYGSAATNDQIEARFRQELMGFHVAFFSLLAFALVHVVHSLWRPVKEYVRQSRALESLSNNEAPKWDSEDGSVGQHGAGVPRLVMADQVGEWQAGDIEMAIGTEKYQSPLVVA